MKVFRIYKSEKLRLRKDGGRVVKSYGCNGKEHFITYDLIWFDEEGKAIDGKSSIYPPKRIGICNYDNTCKNFGFFSI